MTCNGLGQVSNFSTLYGYPAVVGVITLPANTRLEVTHGSQEKDGGQKPYFIQKS